MCVAADWIYSSYPTETLSVCETNSAAQGAIAARYVVPRAASPPPAEGNLCIPKEVRGFIRIRHFALAPTLQACVTSLLAAARLTLLAAARISYRRRSEKGHARCKAIKRNGPLQTKNNDEFVSRTRK